MSDLLNLIRSSAAPPSMMRNAVLGKLNIPAAEQIELLVDLSAHPEWGSQARATLAVWDERELAQVCAQTPAADKLAGFFLASEARRELATSSLLVNPSLAEKMLVDYAARAPADLLPALLPVAVARCSLPLLDALSDHPLAAAVQELLQDARRELKSQHAAAAEADLRQPFSLTRGLPDEEDALAELLQVVEGGAGAVPKKPVRPEEREQITTLQKIAALSVTGRVQLALRGSREERLILIRDGNRLVALAVLESPKLSESDMEIFASMTNVQETVLRGIASRRRFMRIYGVVRALTSNPRTPLDVSLPLVKGLLLTDLKNLMRNKNVSEMISRIAGKVFATKNQRQER